MIGHLRAIIWLRWRLLANAVKGGRRRDRFEQVSRAFALFVPLIVAALSIGTVFAAMVVGFFGGRAAATTLVSHDVATLVVRGVLLAVSALVILFAVSSPAQSALARYTRLLLLPISRRVLHFVEVAANLADPWLIFAAVGVMAFAAGLVAGGRPGAAVLAVLLAIVMLVLLAALASLVSFVVGMLLRSRRRGEMFTLVFVLAISVAGLVPAFLTRDMQSQTREERRAARAARQPFTVERFDASLPAWTQLLPSEIAGRTLRQALAGQRAGAAGGLGLLALQAGILFAASSVAHRRMIESLESDQARRKTAARELAPVRLPLISAAASAIAWAQLRTALRSVRGRVSVLLPGPMVALLALVLRGQRDSSGIGVVAEHGHLIAGAGLVFTLYAIQAFTMNCFGTDRAGLTLQFLSPVRDRDLAWGKTAGGALIVAVAGTLCVAGAFLVNPTGSPFSWLAILLGGAAVYLLMSPFAIWFSALFPVAADMSKTGSGGNPHPLPMLAGTFLVLVFAAPAALTVTATQFWLDRPALAPVLMLAWLAIAVLVALVGVRLAARAIGVRRENLLLVAQR
jgi:hypothetical protein